MTFCRVQTSENGDIYSDTPVLRREEFRQIQLGAESIQEVQSHSEFSHDDHQAALAEVKRELETEVAERLGVWFAELRALENRLQDEYQETVRFIIKEILDTDIPDTQMAKMVRKALSRCENRAPMAIEVHADHVDKIEDEMASVNLDVRVVASKSVSKNGCIIHLKDGMFDAGLMTQLDSMLEILSAEQAEASANDRAEI